jgi:hypothetical protein
VPFLCLFFGFPVHCMCIHVHFMCIHVHSM